MTKTTSAAIVTYNRLELLKESLNAVLKQSDKNLNHILVINNKSTDGTADYLKSIKDKRIIVINSEKNLGGAGGFNLAVHKFIEETNDDFIWLMDDDTIPTKDALQNLTNWFNKFPKTGFVNSDVRWKSINGEPSWMNVVAPLKKTWSRHVNENAVEIGNSTFVSVLIPREMVLKVGLPQKEYFIWGDDIEYTNRISKIYPSYNIINSTVVHKSKENLRSGDVVSENDKERLWRYNYEFRNRILTGRRNSIKKLFFAFGHNTVDFFQVLFGKKVKWRFKKLGLIISGTFKGIFFNPKVEFPKIDEK